MTIKVLLVDDNALFRDGVARILEADGRFSVVGHAAGGEDGVKAAFKLQPDVVLMDLHMPGVGGVEAVKRIRARQPELPIGVFTVFEGDGSIQQALDAGANGYLAKDSSSSEFCDATEALWEGKTELLRPPAPQAADDSRHSAELTGAHATRDRGPPRACQRRDPTRSSPTPSGSVLRRCATTSATCTRSCGFMTAPRLSSWPCAPAW